MREHSLRLSSPDVPKMQQPHSPEYTFVFTEPSTVVSNVDMLQVPPPRKKTYTGNGHHHHHHPHRPHGGLHNGFTDDYNGSSGRILGTLSVVAITFFFGCGGPLGSEPAIASGGPVVALIVLILYPIFFTFPYGAVVAELCTAFPEDGGFPIAVRNAFGPFWGLQVGYLSWVGNIMSTAIYPSFVLDLLSAHASIELTSPGAKYLAKTGIALFFSLPAFFGTRFVSRSMILFLGVVLTTVMIYTIWAYAKADNYAPMGQIMHSNFTYNEDTGIVETSGDVDIRWFDLLNTLFWNYDGIQMASVFGGQVSIPARVYPRAISITIGLTFLCYLLPLPATIANKYIDWSSFVDGSYGDVAVKIGGNALRGIMILLNFATTIGMFISSQFCEATEIAGMAQSGMIPQVLGRRNQLFQSPHWSIALTLLLTLVLMALDNDFLIPVTNAFACLVAVIIFCAGVQLRRRFPHFPRPSTVPGGPGVMMAISVIPILICGFIIYRTLTESLLQFATVFGFVVLGLVLSLVSKCRANDTIVRF